MAIIPETTRPQYSTELAPETHYPPLENQDSFLGSALGEYSEMSTPFIKKSGENLTQFKDFLSYQDWLLKCDLESEGFEITEGERRDLLNAPEYYKSSTINTTLRNNLALSRIKSTLSSIWTEKLMEFGGYLHDETKHYTLSPATIDQPPFFYQGEEVEFSMKLCNNAALRMVFAGITGFSLSEKILDNTKKEKYGESIAPMEFYAGIFRSGHFRSICDKRISLLDVETTSIKNISDVATRIKNKSPETEIYCVPSLGSSIGDSFLSERAHRIALINVQEDYVECHDPAKSHSENFKMPRQEFDVRWALGYNRAFLFISSPGRKADARPVE